MEEDTLGMRLVEEPVVDMEGPTLGVLNIVELVALLVVVLVVGRFLLTKIGTI